MREDRLRRSRNAREETAWRRFCSARSLWSPAPDDPEDVAHSGLPHHQPLWFGHGGRTFTATAEELQQLHQRLVLTIPGRGTNALLPAPSAVLATLDMRIAEIRQDHTALTEPTVKRQCASGFDVKDARSELMIDQRANKRIKMAR